MADVNYLKRANSLYRLAVDQAGKPEGEVAKKKLDELLKAHPELLAQPEPQPAVERRQLTPEEQEAAAQMLRAWVDFARREAEKHRKDQDKPWYIKVFEMLG